MMGVVEVWTLCLAIQFLSAVQGQDIYITSYPSPANFQLGGSISIICEHSTSLTFDYMVHPSFGIISVSTGRFRVVKYRDEVTLTVSNAVESDAGRYKCVLMNGAARVESRYLQAYLHFPILLTPPQQGGNITVAAGDSFNLTCAGENYVTRRWFVYRPQRSLVANTSDGRIELTQDEIVVFRGITLEDEAVYTCVLRNDIGVAIVVANVTIVVRPVTSVTPAVQVVMEGATANFSCHVTGTPLPTPSGVTWRDPNNMEIITSTAQSIGVSIQEEVRTETYLISTLTFASVSGSLTGQYTCRAVNSHGVNSSTGYIRLEGTPDPPANVELTLLNNTNLLVTWDPPNAEVTQYVVTWEAVTGSSALEDPQSAMVDPSGDTSYLITDLHRLTTYSVSIHGINSYGVGMVSSPATATTTATVPSAPLSVVILNFNIGPSTVDVEWPDSVLPTDDGGSPFTNARLTYKAVENGVWDEAWSSEELIVGVEQMSAQVSGLRSGTTYQIRLEVGNEIGYGPGIASAPFVTLQPGHPGSPSHVVASNLTQDSAVVCWRESAFGGPFTAHTVEIYESGATEPVELLLSPSDVGSFPNCSTGAMVSSLQPGTCYRFVVYVTNSQGVGEPSPVSEEYCSASLSSCGEGGVVCDQEANLLSTEAIAGIAVGSVIFLAVLCTIMTCIALRQCKKSSLQRSMNVKKYMDDESRRSDQSLRSTTGLLTSSLRTASFDSCLPPSSADSLQHSPETSTSILSNPEQNPFDFSGNAGLGSHVVLHPCRSQPVLHPHQAGTAMEYPQSMVSIVEQYPMYPILEDPPPYPHHVTRVFPTLAQPVARQHQPLPRYVAPGHTINHGIIVMTENPNYEEERIHGSAFRAGVPRRYYSDHTSEAAESEVSVNPLQIPTPHFGESYSQSGYSPVLQRSHDKTGPGSVNREDSGRGNSQDSGDGVREQGVNLTTQKSSHSDEGFDDDDTEFVENDAYVTFTVPKFKIVSEERGSVFETVKVK